MSRAFSIDISASHGCDGYDWTKLVRSYDWCHDRTKDAFAHDCEQHKELRRRPSGELWKQCTVCGRSGKSDRVPARSVDPETLIPSFDEDLASRYGAEKDAYAASLREQEDRRWWKEYDEYLQSIQWAEIRMKIVDRCGNVCEGCRSAPVEHVHHYHYDRAGRELLVDLAGLCLKCHERIHDQSPDGFGGFRKLRNRQ